MMIKFPVSLPFLSGDGFLLSQARQWINRVSERTSIYTGTGSPEGVLEAPQYALYLDTSAAAGLIQYRKMRSEIGNDKSKGWKLI